MFAMASILWCYRMLCPNHWCVPGISLVWIVKESSMRYVFRTPGPGSPSAWAKCFGEGRRRSPPTFLGSRSRISPEPDTAHLVHYQNRPRRLLLVPCQRGKTWKNYQADPSTKTPIRTVSYTVHSPVCLLSEVKYQKHAAATSDLLVLARSLFPCFFHNDYYDATRCHDCLHTASLPTKSWRSSSGMGEPGGQYFLASMTIIKHADMALGKNWECVSLNSNEYSQEERGPNMKGRKRSPSCNTANFKLGFKFCTLSSSIIPIKEFDPIRPGSPGWKTKCRPPTAPTSWPCWT